MMNVIPYFQGNIDNLKEQKENFQSWFHDAEKAKRTYIIMILLFFRFVF